MRTRLRKYVAVVMALVLCLGIWFQYGQAVQAAGEQTATVSINDNVTLTDVPITGFEANLDGNSFKGTITLDETQTKREEGYFISWYADSGGVNEVATGATPTIDLSALSIKCAPLDDGSYEVFVSLYANFGASHTVSYYMNEQMNGTDKGALVQEISYYQKEVDETGAAYSHPAQPSNGSNFFLGWSTVMSGGVVAPPLEFKYETPANNLELYAIWQAPKTLQVNYYATQEDMTQQNACYDPQTDTQESLEDKMLSVTTPSAPEREKFFFMGWSYEDGTDSIKTVAENTALEIAVADDGTDTILDLYGTWQEAASLTVTYISEEKECGSQNVLQASVTDKTFSFTTAEIEIAKENAVFEGWSYANSDGNPVTIGAGELCSDIPIGTGNVTMTAVWKEASPSGSTIGAGTVTLQADTPYVLESGSWTVTDGTTNDTCVYVGGSTFYVAQTGDYTFTAN